MRKKLLALLALVMTFALSLSIGIMASATSSTEGTPFSTATDNPNSAGSVTVTGGETGPWDVTFDSSYAESDSRMYYGEDNYPIAMDLRTFSMKFSIDSIGKDAAFKIAFLQNQNQFPMDAFGTGFSLVFVDDGSKGLIIKGISHPTGAAFQTWYLVYDNSNPRVEDYTEREITLTIRPQDEKYLHIYMNFSSPRDTTVDFNALYPLVEDFDYTRATLFFNLADHKGSDVELTINEINGKRAADATEPTYPVPDITWTLDQSAPFMTYGDFRGSVDVKKNAETGYTDLVSKSSAGSMNRVWYGETDGSNNNIYSVDITNFTMKFDIDQIASGESLTLAFMSSYNDYPSDIWGTGLSIVFKDSQDYAFGHEHNCGYYVNVNKFSGGQSTLKENGYLIYNNASPRTNSLGKEIVVTSSFQNDVLTITWNFTAEDGASPVGDGIQIAAADLPANFNLSNCVMMFTASGQENVRYSVREINENHTAGYYASEARANAFAAIEAKKAELANLGSIAEYMAADKDVDLSALRLAEKLTLVGWEEEAYIALLDKLVAGDQTAYENTSNYTGNTRNNYEGAYAEYAANGSEYLVLLNKFDQSSGGSSLLMQKKVDITDFEMTYSHQFIAQDTRISFQFADSLEAYNYQQLNFPGLCVLTMFRDGKVNLMITNTSGAQNIEGVALDKYHVLLDESGNWMGMPAAVGDVLTFSLKADDAGNIVVALKNGENSIGTTIPKAFFDGEKLDVTSLYFKMYSGDQGFASGDNKYTVMDVTSIRDASGERALANAAKFIEDTAAVTDIDGAVALLETDVSNYVVYIQDGAIFGEVREAIATLKTFVKDELSALATEYATLAAELEDVSAEVLTKEKIDLADAASVEFYANLDYLVYLSDSERESIQANVITADELLARAKVFHKVNLYLAAVDAIETRADLEAARELRSNIKSSDLAVLKSTEKAVVEKALSDADNTVSEKDATLPLDKEESEEESKADSAKGGCSSSACGSALLSVLALGAVAIIRKRR